MAKKILLGLVAVLLLVQLVPAHRPPVKGDNPADLLTNNNVPEEVAQILRGACYDCHSNETRYPWYAYVAPVKWLVADHVEEGREHLNFSDWQAMDIGDQLEALDELAEEVEEGEMPLQGYPLTHPEARLSEEQRQLLTDWAGQFADQLLE